MEPSGSSPTESRGSHICDASARLGDEILRRMDAERKVDELNILIADKDMKIAMLQAHAQKLVEPPPKKVHTRDAIRQNAKARASNYRATKQTAPEQDGEAQENRAHRRAHKEQAYVGAKQMAYFQAADQRRLKEQSQTHNCAPASPAPKASSDVDVRAGPVRRAGTTLTDLPKFSFKEDIQPTNDVEFPTLGSTPSPKATEPIESGTTWQLFRAKVELEAVKAQAEAAKHEALEAKENAQYTKLSLYEAQLKLADNTLQEREKTKDSENAKAAEDHDADRVRADQLLETLLHERRLIEDKDAEIVWLREELQKFRLKEQLKETQANNAATVQQEKEKSNSSGITDWWNDA